MSKLMPFAQGITSHAVKTLMPSMSPFVDIGNSVINSLNPSDKYAMDAIDMNYVSSVIVPEDYTARQPTPFSVRTAVSHSKLNFTLGTNDAGAAGVYIFPN